MTAPSWSLSTRAPLALRTLEEAPASAIRKLAVRDAVFSPERVVAFAEGDDNRFRVSIYDAQASERRDARRRGQRVLKTPVHHRGARLDHDNGAAISTATVDETETV